MVSLGEHRVAMESLRVSSHQEILGAAHGDRFQAGGPLAPHEEGDLVGLLLELE